MSLQEILLIGFIIMMLVCAGLLIMDIQARHEYVQKYNEVIGRLLEYSETRDMPTFCEIAAVFCHSV